MDEPRLADARLADQGDDLAVAAAGPFGRALERGKLRLASHETGQTARRRGLEPPTRRLGSAQLIGLDRLGDAADRGRAERLDLHEAPGKVQLWWP